MNDTILDAILTAAFFGVPAAFTVIFTVMLILEDFTKGHQK
jgi:hypothetical protein